MARENLIHSDKEEDTLTQSMKKFKENHSPGVDHDPNTSSSISAKGGSYRDKLIRAILGAFKQAFGFSSFTLKIVTQTQKWMSFKGKMQELQYPRKRKLELEHLGIRQLLLKRLEGRLAFITFLPESVGCGNQMEAWSVLIWGLTYF